MNIIIFIIIAIAIIYIVHRTYNQHRYNKKKSFLNPLLSERSGLSEANTTKSHRSFKEHAGDMACDDIACSYDTKPITRILPAYPKGEHQFKHSINDKYKYISTNYGCKRPVQSTKEHHDEFFSFRDKTENNTSIRYDPVDKIMNMKLDGMLNKVTRYNCGNNISEQREPVPSLYNMVKDMQEKPRTRCDNVQDIYDVIVSGQMEYNKEYDEDLTDVL